MFLSDLSYVFKWWPMFFAIGIIFLPLTTIIFSNFSDRGYIFSRILGIAVLSYIVFLLGVLKVLPFQMPTIILVCVICLIINLFVAKKTQFLTKLDFKENWRLYLLEEAIFLAALVFWSYIRGFQPDIHGLEKFMDFGFVNSILRADYFPPRDMWFTPFPINYYYFGHLVTALLTRISQIPSSITYNLMIASLFSLTFTASFSIGINLLSKLNATLRLRSGRERYTLYAIGGGLIIAFLATIGGNIHSIYSFFTPYTNGAPVPFWQLIFSPQNFPNAYWYPNATRFIFNTIHEFPIYSFVVSDLHGHVLDIPFVLLMIAILLSSFYSKNFKIPTLFLVSFLLAVMYMTNVWDAIIYFLLTALVIFYVRPKSGIYMNLLFLIGGTFLFSLPFSKNFTPFVSNIGILCAPKFLTDIGYVGPFLFEPNHCQKSPLWQLVILYGFFYFWVISFIIFLKLNAKRYTLNASDIFVGILIILSTILIIVPEFVYLKDIYPAHYRANTMFKLVYESFIMLSISSGYIIFKIFLDIKHSYLKLAVLIIGVMELFLVGIYPYFAINSYYAGLNSYKGLNGTSYLDSLYSNDYLAIQWINKNIKGQPVILEAQGDSYTDYARISANTGLPTVLGWTVHEWLWRGTYDIPAPRILDVQKIYELNINSSSEEFYTVQSGDYLIKIAAEIKFGDWRNLFELNKKTIENPNLIYPNQKLIIKGSVNNIDNSKLDNVKNLIKKYNISYIYVGDLERQKYPNLYEEKFSKLGKTIFKSGSTKIYKVN
ncbi:MAG: DUF2298 domain-containing protein [Candidatus Levybacteria bacterium]|nr:DUF2298 domain-containing protein [Candidatus Levybacteria bacterium]